MQFIKLTKGSDPIKVFNDLGFFKLSVGGGEVDLEPTLSLVYTLSADGTYYIVGTGFTSIEAIEADTSGGTAGSGLDSTWAGGQLVIPAEHNGLPVKAIAPRALANTTNITEMYIYDGITTIGHRAFQCSTDFSNGWDTTMKACRLPETLISLGGTTSSSSGRVFWGRKGLKVLNIPDSVTYFPTSTFAYVVLDNLIIKHGEVYSYAFQYSDIKQLIVGEEDDANVYQFGQQAFYYANIDYIKINKNYRFDRTGITFDNTNIKKGCIRILTDNYTNGKVSGISGLSPNINYKESELDVIIEKSSIGGVRGISGFGNSNLRSITFRNITSSSTSDSGEGNALSSFTGKYQKLDFGDLAYYSAYYYTRPGTIDGTADRVYFPSLERTAETLFSSSAIIGKVFFGHSNCVLQSLNTNLQNKKCYFKADSLDNYSLGTNWSTLFVNDGEEEPYIFVYKDFEEGEILPDKIGIKSVYTVIWYEDDDFTTPAGSTATANKEYYGKISAVV